MPWRCHRTSSRVKSLTDLDGERSAALGYLCLATYFSTLTTGMLTLGLHGLAFLGGWIEQFGAITQTQRAVNVGVIASVLMPSEALWRRAAFEMQSPLASAMRISPFSTLSVPSMAMVCYAGLYMVIALVIAIRRFSQRKHGLHPKGGFGLLCKEKKRQPWQQGSNE
jgi:hypothetical protein